MYEGEYEVWEPDWVRLELFRLVGGGGVVLAQPLVGARGDWIDYANPYGGTFRVRMIYN